MENESEKTTYLIPSVEPSLEVSGQIRLFEPYLKLFRLLAKIEGVRIRTKKVSLCQDGWIRKDGSFGWSNTPPPEAELTK